MTVNWTEIDAAVAKAKRAYLLDVSSKQKQQLPTEVRGALITLIVLLVIAVYEVYVTKRAIRRLRLELEKQDSVIAGLREHVTYVSGLNVIAGLREHLRPLGGSILPLVVANGP